VKDCPVGSEIPPLERAISALKCALSIDENLPYPWMRLGICYYRKGDLKLAEEAFRKSAELAQVGRRLDEAYLTIDWGTYGAKLGDFYAKCDRYREADQVFTQVQEDHPQSVWAWLFYGRRLMRAMDEPEPIALQKAINAFTRAVKVGPDSPEAHDGLGVALYENGEDSIEQAIVHWNRCLDLNPGHRAVKKALSSHWGLGRTDWE
jgi:tetratricopeptide (TPR) repeat protein